MSCTTSVADSVSDTIAPTPVITAPVITPAVTPRLTSDKGTQSESFPTEPVMDNLDNTKCDQCDFISKSSNGLKIHTRNRHRISQIDGHNEDSESEEIIEKELSFNCDDCEYTSKEEPDLRCHAEKEHFKCSDCDMKLISKSSLKLHKKEKHCDGCGKVVDSYWHHKYLPRGDIYDVCGPDCYVELFNKAVNPPPPPGRMWAWRPPGPGHPPPWAWRPLGLYAPLPGPDAPLGLDTQGDWHHSQLHISPNTVIL